MIENIQNNGVAHVMGKNTAPHADTANRFAAGDSDATLHVRFADMVHQAAQAAQADAEAVRKARELLQSNRLMSPENIRSAAQNILSFGI